MDNFLKVGTKIVAAATTVSGWMAAVLAYITPLYGVFWLMIILLLSDFFTGVAASAKQHIPRSSKRLRRSASKMLCYFGIIYLFWEFEVQLGVDWVATYKFVAGFIFLVEVISILENMFVITEHPVFAKLIKIIRGKAASHHKDGSLLDDILNEKNEK
jgi:phage-related holin